MSRYASVSRDELWIRGHLVERRLSHGEALAAGDTLTATDVADPLLLAACDQQMSRLRQHIPDDARVRLVAEACVDGVSAAITLRIGSFSVVSTSDDLEEDLHLLREIAAAAPHERVDSTLPLLWRNGSAGVLFHEAVGHPAEHGHAPIEWPAWLSVEDTGADLLAGEPPPRMRRASFRDVPMPRMTTLVARQNGSTFELPKHRTEILLVDGGSYEPLTGRVTIRVAAADHVDGDERRRLHPFDIDCTRFSVASSLVGAEGPPLRYPGVICSREGQELVVGSFAPVLLTHFP